ncbi:DUF3099 domain-containing protein [Nocardia nova]|uniref:DUF3099 domain-containing protein n=2 Tax=Actinomycetes TaxID=1760 RepID=A0A2S5ZYG5_9NOCA|nr:DUF3099 domain-containing protein [Nocardia nova]PPJ23219.1 DUF3099 domain-containing protein [Nocardia nova]
MQRDGDSSDLPPESRTSGPGRVGSEREDARAAEPSGSANAAEGPEVSVPADDPRPSGATFERRPPGSIPRPTRASTGYFPGEDKHPVLITEAAPSLEQQHRARVKRYMILMGFRIPCLVLAAAAYGLWSNALISLAIIGVSIPLPWIAVLIANDRPPRSKDEPSRWDERRAAKALESGQHRPIDG